MFPAISKDQLDAFDRYLRTVLWEDELPDGKSHEKFEVHRLKGRVPVLNGNILLVQGVRNVYDTTEAKQENQDPNGEAKLVLIGRGVDQPAFKESLLATLGSS